MSYYRVKNYLISPVGQTNLGIKYQKRRKKKKKKKIGDLF